MTNNTARLIDTAMKALGGRKTQALTVVDDEADNGLHGQKLAVLTDGSIVVSSMDQDGNAFVYSVTVVSPEGVVQNTTTFVTRSNSVGPKTSAAHVEALPDGGFVAI